MVIHQKLKPNTNIDDEEMHLLLRIANLYYENNLTQDQIGKKLGYSRVSIHRFLDRAVKLGLVQFMIHDPGENFINLENQLIIKFNYAMWSLFRIPTKKSPCTPSWDAELQNGWKRNYSPGPVLGWV